MDRGTRSVEAEVRHGEGVMINLWLDDVRPSPIGWVHVYTIEEAKLYLQQEEVDEWSLDHDLGACNSCFLAWQKKYRGEQFVPEMPNCSHFGTGYDLVCWLEENPQFWPAKRPTVHSANPIGRRRMEQVIDRHYKEEQ